MLGTAHVIHFFQKTAEVLVTSYIELNSDNRLTVGEVIREFKIHHGEVLQELLWPRKTRATKAFYPDYQMIKISQYYNHTTS